MKKIILFLLLVPIISCEKKEEEYINDFRGYYKMISMESEIALDLNEDGIAKTDLLDEHKNVSTTDPSLCTTIGPKKGQDKSNKYISFLNIPTQHLNDNGYIHYSSGYMSCTYDFLPNGTMVWINDSYKFNSEKQGDIISLEWDGIDKLTGVFRLRYYIKEEQQWVSPLVTIVFQRVIVNGGDF